MQLSRSEDRGRFLKRESISHFNTSNEGMEEAHWLSFRDAVASVQNMLGGQSPVPAPTVDSSNARRGNMDVLAGRRGGPATNNENMPKSYSASSQDAPRKFPQAKPDESRTFNDNAFPENDGDRVSPISCDVDETGGSKPLDGLHQHRGRLELIGLDEVNKSVDGRNNTANGTFSPAKSPPQASYTSDSALSIAEVELAKTKLKLAMAESERDEFEFQLMQNI